jgi:hypothetical protein
VSIREFRPERILTLKEQRRLRMLGRRGAFPQLEEGGRRYHTARQVSRRTARTPQNIPRPKPRGPGGRGPVPERDIYKETERLLEKSRSAIRSTAGQVAERAPRVSRLAGSTAGRVATAAGKFLVKKIFAPVGVAADLYAGKVALDELSKKWREEDRARVQRQASEAKYKTVERATATRRRRARRARISREARQSERRRRRLELEYPE